MFNGDYNNPKCSDSVRTEFLVLPGHPDVLLYDGHIQIGDMNYALGSEIAQHFLADKPELAVAYSALYGMVEQE